MNELNQSLVGIQQELKAPKGQFNRFANFNYRSCEDILESVKPLLHKRNITLVIEDEIYPIGDRYYVKSTAKISDGENEISAHAFAREAEIKTGMDAAQITGAASSYARKYALNGLFCIDDTKDADSQDNSVKPVVTKKSTKPASSVKKTAPSVDMTQEEIMETLDNAGKDAFRDEDGEVSRDHKGHTACVECGKVVGKDVESYSLGRYKRVLCRDCQKKATLK